MHHYPTNTLPLATNANEKALISYLRGQDETIKSCILFILGHGLPKTIEAHDRFVLFLLKNYKWPTSKHFIFENYEDDVISYYKTPFKGLKQTPTLLKDLVKHGFIDKRLGDQLHNVISSRTEALAQVDETSKCSLQMDTLTNKIQDFYTQCNQNNDKMLWNFFILKCLTGPRTKQLASLRVSDVWFQSNYESVCIRYRYVKGQEGTHIYHTFSRNESKGPLKDEFDIVLLYKKQVFDS